MDVPDIRTSPEAGSASSLWKYIILIVIAVGIVYGQSVRFDFVTYDDYELVYQNGDFLSHVSNVFASFTTHAFTTHRAESGYYRPVLLVSYILDYQIWGLNPSGYHLTNLLLHCCAAIIVFLILGKLLAQSLMALLGSLLFALHPAQTESVGWIAGRNDILLGLFVGISFLSYLYYREEGPERKKFLSISVISFVLALFTKEPAAFYLLLLPAYDFFVKRKSRPGREYALEMMPFVVALLFYLIVRKLVIGEFIGAERLYGTAPMIDRVSLLPAMVAAHAALIFYPFRLSVVHPIDSLPWTQTPWSIAAVVMTLSLIVFGWYIWKRKNDGVLAFGLLWFLVGLIPVTGIIPVAVPILEHRLYLPLIGISILAARCCALLSGGQMRKPAVAIAVGAILLVCAVTSFLRLPVWRDSTTLWRDAIEKAPGVSRSYFNLAGFYFERQQYDSTASLLNTYIRLKPDDFLGYSKLRQTYFLAGKYDDAARINRLIIMRNPSNAARYLEAGLMYEQLQRFDSAAALYNEGLLVDSNNIDLQLRLGSVYQSLRNGTLAERHLRRATEIAPQDARVLFAYGALLASQYDNLRAIEFIERGLKLAAPPRSLLTLLKQLYTNSGQPEKARQLAERYHL